MQLGPAPSIEMLPSEGNAVTNWPGFQKSSHFRIYENRSLLHATLEILSRKIDDRLPSTAGHSHRVARYSVMIGAAMDLAAPEMDCLKWASIFHDIGKIHIPERILSKPAPLTPREYRAIKRHVEHTRVILDRCLGSSKIAHVASCHHEKWDGSGYPLGLLGEQIPGLARILAVADAFDAMTSDRSYRTAVRAEEACQELLRGAEVYFDPAIVEAAVPVLSYLSPLHWYGHCSHY